MKLTLPHIFHLYNVSEMTHSKVISKCRICGKEKSEPWYQIAGWCRPPIMPPNPILRDWISEELRKGNRAKATKIQRVIDKMVLGDNVDRVRPMVY